MWFWAKSLFMSWCFSHPSKICLLDLKQEGNSCEVFWYLKHHSNTKIGRFQCLLRRYISSFQGKGKEGVCRCSHPVLSPNQDCWFEDKTIIDPWHLYNWHFSHSQKVLDGCIFHFVGAQICVTHLLLSESSGWSSTLMQDVSLFSCCNRCSN